jgi:hypothetical protein
MGMSRELEEALSDWLDNLRSKREKAEVEEILNRKITPGDIREALENASPEERAELRAFLRDEAEDTKSESEKESRPKPPPARKAEKKKEAEAPPLRTRPGRKAGHAYDWDTDEKGEVVPLSVARVFSGESEPDEVEISGESEDEDTTAEAG